MATDPLGDPPVNADTVGPGVRHIVLVHGAWQGSWAFDAWSPHLRRRGWQVHAVDLPGNHWGPDNDSPAFATLQGYTDHVCGLIERLGEPVVLVGHSGGGITVSQVAETLPDKVACLVYLAGMMLPSGFSFLDLMAACRRQDPSQSFDGIAPFLRLTDDGLSTVVSVEGALAKFVHDCEPGAARQAASLLRPQAESGRAMVNRLSAERFGTVPRIYVECRDDQSVLLPMQRMMQQMTPGALCVSLDCGHVPQLALPDLLTEELSAALATVIPGRMTPTPNNG